MPGWESVQQYGPMMLAGIWVTLKLVFWAVSFGFLLALPLTWARFSRHKLLRQAAFLYSYVFRGTPVLAQLFFVYYGSGQFRSSLEQAGLWLLFREPFFCAALTFALNSAAHQSEIFRGAIRSVSADQSEAAQALGLSPFVTFRKIILPQAALLALRPMGNEVILTVKASAVASIITVLDLMGVTRVVFARTFDLQIYLWAAVCYLIVVEAVRWIVDRLEWRLTRHLRTDAARTIRS